MFIDVIDVQIRLPSRLRLETFGFHVSLFVAHRKFHKTLPITDELLTNKNLHRLHQSPLTADGHQGYCQATQGNQVATLKRQGQMEVVVPASAF